MRARSRRVCDSPRGDPSTISIATTPGAFAVAAGTLLRLAGTVSIATGDVAGMRLASVNDCSSMSLRSGVVRPLIASAGAEHVDVLALVERFESLEQHHAFARLRRIGRDAALGALERAMVGDVGDVEPGAAGPRANVVLGPTGASVVRVLGVRVKVDGDHQCRPTRRTVPSDAARRAPNA